MIIEYRRIARASLDSALDDGGDRSNMPMQTLIGIDADPPNYRWLLEASWDGSRIGDVQVFVNRDGDGLSEPEATPNWEWFAGVPSGKVKSYRFASESVPTRPATYAAPTKPDVQLTSKPGQADQGVAKPRSGA